MTTSISSEAQRNQTSIIIRGQELTFPPKPDRQTNIRTYGRTFGRTNISNYRVASLLKNMIKMNIRTFLVKITELLRLLYCT